MRSYIDNIEARLDEMLQEKNPDCIAFLVRAVRFWKKHALNLVEVAEETYREFDGLKTFTNEPAWDLLCDSGVMDKLRHAVSSLENSTDEG